MDRNRDGCLRLGVTRWTTRTLHGSAMLGPSQPSHLSIRKLPYPSLTLTPTLPLLLTRKLSACVALVADHPNVLAYLAQRPVTPL